MSGYLPLGAGIWRFEATEQGAGETRCENLSWKTMTLKVRGSYDLR